MKRFFLMAITAGICLIAASSDAQAVIIDFETMDTTNVQFPGLVVHGDSVTQSGYYFQTFSNAINGEGSLVGALMNGADPSTCLMDQCPTGNATNYIAALNDGYIEFGRLDGGNSRLLSLDAAFVASPDAPPLAIPGLLRIMAYHSDGSYSSLTYYLGAIGSGGTTAFTNYQVNFADDAVAFIAFAFRCNSFGLCQAFQTNEGQFAIDNLVLQASGSTTAVPEPATWAMLLLGFGGIGTMLRRQRNARPQSA